MFSNYLFYFVFLKNILSFYNFIFVLYTCKKTAYIKFKIRARAEKTLVLNLYAVLNPDFISHTRVAALLMITSGGQLPFLTASNTFIQSTSAGIAP